jgi:hypothetical protein
MMPFPREKQIEFPPMQTHNKWVAPACWILSIVCIIAVVIIVLSYEGSFIGPW